MQLHKTLPWADPLALARVAAGCCDSLAFLYSGKQVGGLGHCSILAYGKEDEIKGEHFDALEAALRVDCATYEHAWFGYLGYGLRHDCENVPRGTESVISLPNLWFMRFRTIYIWQHDTQVLTVYFADESELLPAKEIAEALHPTPAISTLYSSMQTEEYLARVEHIRERIFAGDLYQANLTRKFYGHFNSEAYPFDLYLTIISETPTPYSAYFRFGDTHLLSASPERFLKMDAQGHINTQPIKGTQAAEIAQLLKDSEKDRAENLMIVDLMRNDLSRVCVPGSVQVDSLYDVTRYTSLHHMSSSISGQKRSGTGAVEVVKACFPPGSMTGTPKIMAMKLCTALEGIERGVYSGALGWFGGDGSMDLSVVIRTLIIQGKRFEFQVGGGIVADSTPEAELKETLVKARAICRPLGITEEMLLAASPDSGVRAQEAGRGEQRSSPLPPGEG